MLRSPARNAILRPGYDAARRRFIAQLPQVLGTVPIAGFLPHRDDRLTSIDPWSGRVWTAEATMEGRLFPQGRGTSLSFNGTSNILTTPDTNDLSFGNGTVDSAFSVLALANITNTAAFRVVVSKWNATGSAREWELFLVDTTDAMQFLIRDESAAVSVARTSDAAVTQGSFRLFGATYSAATGGATAGNDMTLYQDGVAIASTATNSGSYVAMENLGAAGIIGAQNAGAAAFFSGSQPLIVICSGARTAAQMAGATSLCRLHFGAPL